MEMKGVSQAELSAITGLSEKTIVQIIEGIESITYETATKLELALGVPAQLWNNMEKNYRTRPTSVLS